MAYKTLLYLPFFLSLALAKPIHHDLEDRRHSPRQLNRPDYIPEIITTSLAGPLLTPRDMDSPTSPESICAITLKVSEDQRCGLILDRFEFRYTLEQSVSPAGSDLCVKVLLQHGICLDTATSATSATPTLSAKSSSQTFVSTFTPDTSLTTTTRSESLDKPKSSTTTTTLTLSTTMTYTLGSTSRRVTSVVITRTRTQTLTLASSSVTSVSSAANISTLPTSSSANFSTPLSSSSANVSTGSTLSSTHIASSTKYVPSFTTNPGCAGAPTSSILSSISICPSAPAPAATQSGIVSGCTEWHVAVPGDFCYSVAQRAGIDVNTFMAWNPAVEPPTCQRMLAGLAYCVATCNNASLVGSTASAPAFASQPSAFSTASPPPYSARPSTMALQTTIASETSFSLCAADVTPPASTQPGTVKGCLKWTVAELGDTCDSIANQFGISADTFMAWNPSVMAPWCADLLAGDAYCVAWCGGTSMSLSLPAEATTLTYSSILTESSLTTTILSTTTSTFSAISSSAAPNPTISPSDRYVSYCGDGSTAAGWPSIEDWLTFDYLFRYNEPNMKISCQQWGVQDDTETEIEEMRQSILTIGNATQVDPRFILAIIMQESTGCVRVITTAYSHANPGLMQSYNGTGSCNPNNAPLGLPGVVSAGQVLYPCPEKMIYQQVLDGTNGTTWGPGLVQDRVVAQSGSVDPAQVYYRTARIYNGGTFVPDDLSQPCCTTSYASDIANRLMGWRSAARSFTCT